MSQLSLLPDKRIDQVKTETVRLDPKLFKDELKIYADILQESFVDTVERHGVMVAVFVRRDKKKKSGYKIVFGHRRLAAAIAANVDSVRGEVLPDDWGHDGVLAEIENIARQSDPVQDYKNIKKLRDEGHKATEIRAAIGMESAMRYGKLVKLDKLIKPILDAFLAHNVKETVAVDVAGLGDGDQKKCAKILKDKGILRKSDVDAVKGIKKDAGMFWADEALELINMLYRVIPETEQGIIEQVDELSAILDTVVEGESQ